MSDLSRTHLDDRLVGGQEVAHLLDLDGFAHHPVAVIHPSHLVTADAGGLNNALLVGPVGLEPTTRGLKVRCSTD